MESCKKSGAEAPQWSLEGELPSILTGDERTQFLLRHILGTINSHLSFKPLQQSLFSFIPACSLFLINTDVLYAYGISDLVANGTEHAVCLRYPAVTSFSSANGIREFRVEKFMPAFCATERIDFSAYKVNRLWLVPMKMITAL
jgi:hypothetical protein